jgi:hypothetical protein
MPSQAALLQAHDLDAQLLRLVLRLLLPLPQLVLAGLMEWAAAAAAAAGVS